MAGNIADYLARRQQRRARQVVAPPAPSALPPTRPAMSVGTGNPMVDTQVTQQALEAARVEQQMAANQMMLEEARRRRAAQAPVAAPGVMPSAMPAVGSTAPATRMARPQPARKTVVPTPRKRGRK